MPVSWNKKYSPVEVIEKLEATRKSDDKGKVSFSGWGHQEFKTLIYSMLNFSEVMPEIDARQTVSRAIFIAGARGKITAKTLLTEINKLEKKYHSNPSERYALSTSISLSQSIVIPRIRFGRTQIIFEPSLPKKFEKEASKILVSAKQSLFAEIPKNYLKVRVHISARSIHHAATQALDDLNLTRAIWNWVLNKGHTFRFSYGGKPKPVNKIILGPVHTIHEVNGILAAKNNWWYEPTYLGAISPYSPKKNESDIIIRSFLYAKELLKTHKYPEVLKSAFIRYTMALDERNWTTAFLKLWSILELLTDTTQAAYDVTIRRTAFLYQERDYQLQVLKHLREYRNSSVHFDKESSEIEIYLYQLKNYVEDLLNFHLRNHFGFQTHQESTEFLDLPYKDKILKTKIEKLELARKFFGYK